VSSATPPWTGKPPAPPNCKPPPPAAARWARLDQQLTNLAIWLPTVPPNETDLISRRTGNYQYNPVSGALIDQLRVR